MHTMTKKAYYLRKLKMLLGTLPSTIYFNFHYLPFKQAIKLPIWIKASELACVKGEVILDVPVVTTGMVTLGYKAVSIYPKKGIMWENKGGRVIFHGKCRIGNDSYLSIGSGSTVHFGDDFRNSAAMKLISKYGVTFGDHTSMGWDTITMDSSLHSIIDTTIGQAKPDGGPIVTGAYNWFGAGCRIMPNVNTPERCIFGMNSLITRGSQMESYCLMGGSPVRILTRNVTRDFDADE